MAKKKSHKSIVLCGTGFLAGIFFTVLSIFGVCWYFTTYGPGCFKEAGIVTAKTHDTMVKYMLVTAESKLASAKDEYERWIALGDLAVILVDVGELERAREYANEVLALAPKYKDDWNYGNAIHGGHIAIGRIELRNGNLDNSKNHLLAAGRTPGSPQLDSFGPSMILAKELLEKGEDDAIVKYLNDCGIFWKQRQIRRWIKIIEEGGIPNFGANLLY